MVFVYEKDLMFTTYNF